MNFHTGHMGLLKGEPCWLLFGSPAGESADEEEFGSSGLCDVAASAPQ